MKWIHRQHTLRELRERWGMRDDWHEPDEQEVDIEVVDGTFDNAHCDESEAHVILVRRDERIAINLANLLAWGSR